MDDPIISSCSIVPDTFLSSIKTMLRHAFRTRRAHHNLVSDEVDCVCYLFSLHPFCFQLTTGIDCHLSQAGLRQIFETLLRR